MLLYVLLLGYCLELRAAQECNSPTFNFANFINPGELDLTTPPATVIASFHVENVQSVTVVPQPAVYIAARLVASELQFVTTENFTQYEEHEVRLFIILQMSYTCTTGVRQGIFRQNLKPANNHAPRFLEEVYQALVPLPLPKNFDISPYLANGAGVMARDIDLINNTIQFSVSKNDYIIIESHPVLGDSKQFKAILRLKEQVLKLSSAVELTVTATDRGEPPKSTLVSLTIRPDVSIVYEDPPEFKDTFVNRTMEDDLLIQLELIPGTNTKDVQYRLEGSDSKYFSISVWANNSGLHLTLVNLDALPHTKTFLNVVAVGTRSELQKTSSVILLAIPAETTTSTVQNVLVVLHLEEMKEHRDIFPLMLGDCVFSIESQTPGKYFFVDKIKTTLSSMPFDREDEKVFSGLDFPQFWVVLKLSCPSSPDAQEAPYYADLTRLGPMRDIAYSTELTHLNIVVQDINDNSPEFTYPSSNARFAFPLARLAQKILPEQLVKVEASDRDDGINAIIRYRLAINEHFDIDARTGVIFPLKNALNEESSTTVEIHATDRDGASDGNTSTMKIKVFRASEEQLLALTVEDIDPRDFEQLLEQISVIENVDVGAVRSVYTVTAISNSFSERQTTIRYATKAIVYAFEGDTLLSYNELIGIFKSQQINFTIKLSTIDELYMSQSTVTESDTTLIYPYIIIAAFFGTLAIGMTAAAFYFRAKTRNLSAGSLIFPSETASNNSNAIIVENAHNCPSCRPSLDSNSIQQLSDVTTGESGDNREAPAECAVHSLAELLSMDETTEHEKCHKGSCQPSQQEQKKSIKFNERVERIEVFDKYSEH